jgi:hypothetical protein
MGGAKLEMMDNRTSLFLDGNDDYATIPRFYFHNTDLTIGIWIKMKSPSTDKMYIFSDENSSGKGIRVQTDNDSPRVDLVYAEGNSDHFKTNK